MTCLHDREKLINPNIKYHWKSDKTYTRKMVGKLFVGCRRPQRHHSIQTEDNNGQVKSSISIDNITYASADSLLNPFPNKPWFSRVCSRSLLKTLQEKEELVVTSNFSFSHSVFYPFQKLSAIFIKSEIAVCKVFQFGSLKFIVWERVHIKISVLLIEWCYDPFPNKPLFLRICSKSLSKPLWEKKKLLIMSTFSFSHSLFYLFGELSAISI